MLKQLVFPFSDFFKSHPALLFGLVSTVSTLAALFSPLFLIFLSPLPFFDLSNKERYFLLIFSLSLFLLTPFRVQLDGIPKEGIEGRFKVSIDRVSLVKARHGKTFLYFGRVLEEMGDNKRNLRGLPLFFSLKETKKGRIEASSDIILTGKIVPGKGHLFLLKQKTNVPPEKASGYSFAEARFQMKLHIKEWIEEKFEKKKVGTFLSGLVIGEFDDRDLKGDFGRFGLLHLLAISGFHFSIFASLFSKLLSPFLRKKPLGVILILLLTSYFLLLGPGPSVLRAWMTILLLFSSHIFERIAIPLNSLGASLLFSTLYDPLLLFEIGFQFSFLTTAAILMLLNPTKEFLDQLFPMRSAILLKTWPLEEKIGYLLLSIAKGALALTLATSIVAAPFGLYLFGAFPIGSLLFNLFFPFLVSISMLLLVATLAGSLFFSLGKWISALNDFYTSLILNMASEAPEWFDLNLTCPNIPTWLICLFISAPFLVIIYINKRDNSILFTKQTTLLRFI